MIDQFTITTTPATGEAGEATASDTTLNFNGKLIMLKVLNPDLCTLTLSVFNDTPITEENCSIISNITIDTAVKVFYPLHITVGCDNSSLTDTYAQIPLIGPVHIEIYGADPGDSITILFVFES